MAASLKVDWSQSGPGSSVAGFAGSLTDWRRLGSVACGRFLRDLPIPADILAELNGIYSQTTEAERRFLFNYMAHLWSGRHGVMEVGPYLGGTTRCIGKGMLANPRATPETRRFFCLDFFESYENREILTRDTQKLVDAYAPGDQEIAEQIAKRGWEKLFRRVHQGADYGAFIDIRKTQLPDRVGQPIVPELAQAASDAGPLEVLFIDGCKSWYGTKICMKSFLPSLIDGGHVIFQDYGRYTCFWISAFIHSLGDRFALQACMSGTYAFVARGTITAEEIDQRFPDDPEAWPAEHWDKFYKGILGDVAFAAGDAPAAVRLTLHLAAALATIGHLDAARAIIDRLADEPFAAPLVHEVREARKTPTWNHKGVVYL